ncbi:unnamed protein product [Effrenium voratum]|nr:unnamed protein product [Effrenium voratum]
MGRLSQAVRRGPEVTQEDRELALNHRSEALLEWLQFVPCTGRWLRLRNTSNFRGFFRKSLLRLMSQPELPSEYLLGSPKSSLRSQSPSARSPSNSNRSPRSQARAWKKADPQESLSLEDLRGLLRLKEQAIRLLQEEVVELHGSLESQRQVEARYRHLDALLTQEEQEKPAGPCFLERKANRKDTESWNPTHG